MSLSDFCIKRPVFAAVLSILIVVLGIASLLRLPIRELPDVDAAIISVSTGYTGAAPEIVDTDISAPIEGVIAGIAGVKSIGSTSQRGGARTVIEFEPGRQMDEAANDVRDAVARVRSKLPAEIDDPQITKNDSNSDPVMRIAITSDRMTPAEITDFAERFIVDRLATLDGVAQVQVYGERRYAIRIWLDRRAMAARNLTVDDVESALERNNVELPAGELKSTLRQFIVRTDTRLSTPKQFADIVLERVDGYPVRLGDIASVVRGVEDDQTMVRSDGRDAVGVAVLRQSQANTIAISNRVRAQLDLIRPTLPEGMDIEIGSDDAVFINQSIHEVVRALGIAVALVVLVIFAFLASARATLVPAVTIPVAVIGAFTGIYALGFSINVLTLLALILAIGIVVDDAIVVLENIQRRIELGESPLVAGVLGARQVTFAVIATSLTLTAVFVPISFLEGRAGRLFTEFGFVLAVAVLISMLVALTLCPALCTKLLRGAEERGAVGRLIERGLRLATRGYAALLTRALDAPILVLLIATLMAGASWGLYRALPQELTPLEDRGVFFVPVTAPQGATIAYTDAEVRKVETILQPLRASGEVARIYTIVGRSGQPHRAVVVARLVPWSQRTRDQQAILRPLIPALSALPGVQAFPASPAGLGLGGSRTPLQLVVGGPNYQDVKRWSQAIMDRAEANPGLLNVESDFEENQPQFDVLIDRDKADDLGIGAETIGRTLQTMLASREITEYVDRGREYPVIVQARAEDRRTPTDLANIFVRSTTGNELVPLAALVHLNEGADAPALRRYNRLPSITISAALADGYDLGSAIRFMQRGRGGDPAARGGGRLRRPVAAVPRDLERGRGHLRPGTADRVPRARGPVRELRPPPDHHALGAARGLGCLAVALADRQLPQHLQRDRDHPVDRPDGQERHIDRRVREPVARSGPSDPGRGGRGLGAAAAPDRDDRGLDHPGRGAARAGDRRRRREPECDRHRGDRRPRHRLGADPDRHARAVRSSGPLHPPDRGDRARPRAGAARALGDARGIAAAAGPERQQRSVPGSPALGSTSRSKRRAES